MQSVLTVIQAYLVFLGFCWRLPFKKGISE